MINVHAVVILASRTFRRKNNNKAKSSFDYIRDIKIQRRDGNENT